jgi:hypothetical protein
MIVVIDAFPIDCAVSPTNPNKDEELTWRRSHWQKEFIFHPPRDAPNRSKVISPTMSKFWMFSTSLHRPTASSLQTTAAIIGRHPLPLPPLIATSKWNNETDTQAIFVECSAPLFDKERFDFHCYPSTVEAGAI